MDIHGAIFDLKVVEVGDIADAGHAEELEAGAVLAPEKEDELVFVPLGTEFALTLALLVGLLVLVVMDLRMDFFISFGATNHRMDLIHGAREPSQESCLGQKIG